MTTPHLKGNYCKLTASAFYAESVRFYKLELEPMSIKIANVGYTENAGVGVGFGDGKFFLSYT